MVRTIALGAAIWMSIAVVPVAASAAGLVWSGPFPLENGGGAAFTSNAVACPEISECVAVGGSAFHPYGGGLNHNGVEATFDPLVPGLPVPVTVNGSTSVNDEVDLLSVGCASASLCLAEGGGSGEEQFDPASPATTVMSTIGLHEFACPSATQCTGSQPAMGAQPGATTINPAAPGQQTLTSFGPSAPLAWLGNDYFSCASTQQCTSFDYDGSDLGPRGWTELTFDPTSTATPTPVALGASGGYYAGSSCPTTTACMLALQNVGLVTVDPLAPAGAALEPIPGPGGNDVNGLACPSSDLCVVTDRTGGHVVSFDPASPADASSVKLKIGLGFPGDGPIACPAANECVAVDFSEGAFVGLAPGTVKAGLASLGKPTVSGASASLPVSCAGTEGEACAVTLELTASFGSYYGSGVIATAAGKISAGKSTKLKLTLNSTGTRLLAKEHRVTATGLLANLGENGTISKTLTLNGK